MAQPNLGYGHQTEASIDAVNQWMRAQPWWQSIKGGSANLNETQRRQVLRAAQANGVVIDEGDIEIDPAGNLNPKGHKLRNTIVIAGIAAATIATAGAAGAFSGAAASAGGAAGAGGAAAAGGTAATIGGAAAGGGAATAAGGGLAATLTGYGLKYALPVAGQLIGGRMQANAERDASAINQKYLDEALAYAKEQDAYNRQRQTGLDQQDRDRYAYSTGTDANRYGDTQQEYLADFARNENRYAYSTDLEASRYGDYSKRIAPYLATGASANDRMASLLGLPAGPAFDPTLTPGPTRKVSLPPTLNDPGHGFGGSSAGGDRTGQNFDPAYIGQQLDALYAQHGVSATGPGTGPTDKAYMIQAIQGNKGWEPYWQDRIAQELAKAGVGH